MVDRETIEQIKAMLHELQAVALEQGEQTLCYLINVAKQEAEDVLSGRFERGLHVEAFTTSAVQ